MSIDPSSSKFKDDLKGALESLVAEGDGLRKRAGKLTEGGNEKQMLYERSMQSYDLVLSHDSDNVLAYYGKACLLNYGLPEPL